VTYIVPLDRALPGASHTGLGRCAQWPRPSDLPPWPGPAHRPVLVEALSFVLPTSIGQALIIAVAVLAFPLQDGEPLLPVQPVQILWINLIVAVALALPLALEAPEPDLMERPPRDRARQYSTDRWSCGRLW
jgi:hypothetical protein